MITLRVNNKLHQFSKKIALKEVLDQLQIPQTGIAVAINQTIVTESDWDATPLADNDTVLIIQATQGG